MTLLALASCGKGGAPSKPPSVGAEVTPLEQRINQLEARVTAVERQAPHWSGTEQTVVRGGSAPNSNVVPSFNPTNGGKSGLTQTAAHSPAGAGGSLPPSGATAFEIVTNPELKGRFGRIVVGFPPGTKDLLAQTEVFKPGDANRIRSGYGNFEAEFIPGTYDLNVSGHRFAGVVVERGSDTRVKVGVLRLITSSANTNFEVFEVGGKNRLQGVYGQKEIGLPIGTYEVEVNGQREKVKIESDRITEY